MANAVGEYPSPSSRVEVDRPSELECCTSSELEDRSLDFAGCAIVIRHLEWLGSNLEDLENDGKCRLVWERLSCVESIISTLKVPQQIEISGYDNDIPIMHLF